MNTYNSGNWENYTIQKQCYRNAIPTKSGKLGKIDAVPLIDIVNDFRWAGCTNEQALREIPKIHMRFYQQTHNGLISALNRWFLLFNNGSSFGADLLKATGITDPSYIWETPYDLAILGVPLFEIIAPYGSNEILSTNNQYGQEAARNYIEEKIKYFNPLISPGIFADLYKAMIGSNITGSALGGFGQFFNSIPGPLKWGTGLLAAAPIANHLVRNLDNYSRAVNLDFNKFESFRDAGNLNLAFEIELLNTDSEGEANVIRNFEFVNFLTYNLSPRRRNLSVRDVPVVVECFNGTEYLPYAAVDLTVTKKGRSRIITNSKSKLEGQTVPDAYKLAFRIRSLMEHDGRLQLQALKGYDSSGNISNVIGSTKVFTSEAAAVNAIASMVNS